MTRTVKFALLLLAFIASGCASLPPIEGRPDSTAMRDTGNTRLGRTIAPLAARNGARPADQAAYLEPGTPVKAGLTNTNRWCRHRSPAPTGRPAPAGPAAPVE